MFETHPPRKFSAKRFVINALALVNRKLSNWISPIPYPPIPLPIHSLILPLSSNDPIGQGVTAKITSRPQCAAFRIEQIIVSDAENWDIDGIQVGNNSQLACSGSITADTLKNVNLKLETLQTAMDFSLFVTYRGGNRSGGVFHASAIGTAVLDWNDS